ncbi:hypothetical protein ACU4I5_33415 (plasmid) [Ensifer adhaerens]
MNIAIAPCCWGIYWPQGNDLGWTDYLDRIHAAGYRHTELGPYGYFSTDAKVLSSELARRDLKVVAAAHVHTLADASTWPVLEEKAQAICKLLAENGGTHFILMDRIGVLSEGPHGGRRRGRLARDDRPDEPGGRDRPQPRAAVQLPPACRHLCRARGADRAAACRY